MGILILAGGNSSRMGSIKQLLSWEQTTLMEHAVHQAEMSDAYEVLVVLGANIELIKEKISVKRAGVIENNSWELGLGTSISCGVTYAISNWGNLDGVMIMLADQPLVDTLFLNQIMEKFKTSEKGIVATKYGKRVGVPAIFSQAYFGELVQLNDDFGAKKIMTKYKNDIFEIDGQGKTEDIDTLEDYKRLKKFKT